MELSDFNLQLPPLPTLTPQLTLPNPHISVLFLEATPYQVPENPFQGNLHKALEEAHKQSLEEAIEAIRGPFLYIPSRLLEYNRTAVGLDTTAEEFNTAVVVVTAAIERGYYPLHDLTSLRTNS
jgi:hypothetical protein